MSHSLHCIYPVPNHHHFSAGILKYPTSLVGNNGTKAVNKKTKSLLS